MSNQRKAFEAWCAIKPVSDWGEGAWDAWQASRKAAIDEIINMFISSTTTSEGFEKLRKMENEK